MCPNILAGFLLGDPWVRRAFDLARLARRLPRAVVVLLIVVVFLVGCASERLLWVRPDYTPELFARDRYECLRDARGPGMAVVLPAREWGRVVVPALVVPGSPTVDDGMFRECMAARGWTLTVEGAPGPRNVQLPCPPGSEVISVGQSGATTCGTPLRAPRWTPDPGERVPCPSGQYRPAGREEVTGLEGCIPYDARR